MAQLSVCLVLPARAKRQTLLSVACMLGIDMFEKILGLPPPIPTVVS